MKLLSALFLTSILMFSAGVANATPVSDNTLSPISQSSAVGKIVRGVKPKTVIAIKGNNKDMGQDIRYLKNSVAKSFPDNNLQIVGKALYGDNLIVWNLPKDYQKVTIEGKGTVTKEQAAALIRLNNYALPIDATAEEIVDYYYVEASREGIKWDIALCQALVETGFFHFGGTVLPEQNNFCGLGTTSATVKGEYFLTPVMGVRAHIQHLLAYIRTKEPKTDVVDPRYEMVRDIKARTGHDKYWYDLNGKWAMGSEYAEKILDIHEQMKQIVSVHGI